MPYEKVIHIENYKDDDGNPAGGVARCVGVDIDFQDMPLVIEGVRNKPTGAFVEDLLVIAKNRLEFYQDSKFVCSENEAAIGLVDAALSALNSRTRDREARGVEGTHQV